MSILVATDFSDGSTAALRKASQLASARELPLQILHCVETAVEGPPWGHMLEIPPDMEEQLEAKTRERLEELVDETLGESRPASVEYRVELAHPDEGILAAVSEGDVELVVLGATGRSRLAKVFVGSTAEEVVRGSSRPVLVVPGDARTDVYESIVAPVDLTNCSRASLRMAVDIARDEGARLHVLHVYASPSSNTGVFSSMFGAERSTELREERRREFESFVDEMDFEGVDVETTFETGTPHRQIVELVEETDAGLAVLGTHGRRGLDRMVLGSTASKVLRQMPCSIMTVRESDGGGN